MRANPVVLRWGDLDLAFSAKTIEGAIGPPSLFSSIKSYEIAKYITVLAVNYIPGVLIANESSWNKLTEDQKKIIKDSTQMMVGFIEYRINSLSYDSINKMQNQGAEVLHPEDISEYRIAVEPIFNELSAELPQKLRLLASQIAYVKRELEICSNPQGGTVYYREYGNRSYNTHQSLTDTAILLNFSVWQIRLEKDQYFPQEKEFNPNTTNRWRVDFELRKRQ